MHTTEQLKKGTVYRVLPDGHGFVQDVASKYQYVFSVTALQNYRGESVGELALRKGTEVHFRAVGDRVAYLELVH
ncbi:hypothetical protein [Gloeobacter violaceus]|uniref:hypothetical protein n=1 Tax=Gloeobacter violaceus TaxID=33072 RepID=UPI0002FE5B46|nr:hypothetical protein [Gloeobacter violaceus]